MRQTSRTRLLISIFEIVVAVILLLIPFLATLTVWLSTNLGHYTALRLWKEFLLVPIGVVMLVIVYRDRDLRRRLNDSWLYRLSIAYILLTVGLGFVALARHEVDKTALGYALIINLRLVVFFWMCVFVASYSKKLHRNWQKLVLIPAAAVVLFGLLQHFVLPANFLSHLGYGVHTISPFETVDQNNQYVRVQSTLRGPNPLGAYLVVVITSLSILFIQARNRLKRWTLLIYGLASLVVLFLSYSREAWIGVISSIVLAIWFGLLGRSGRWIASGLIVVAIVGSAVAYVGLRHNLRFEDTFLHTSSLSSSKVSSNQSHESSLISGVKQVIHQPLGGGPGTAGPASVYNNHPARISENYYIQIAQEIGIAGLVLFISINVIVAAALWQNRDDQLSLVLLCSLVGLCVVNLFSHAWADDTLAYIWWGLAGIAVAPVIIGRQEHLSNETQKTKKKTTF